MKPDFSRPDYLCWAAAPLMALAGLFSTESTFNVYLHDAYYAISYSALLILTALLLLILGFVYRLIIQKSGRGTMALVKGHLWLTLFCAAVLMAAGALTRSASAGVEGGMAYSYWFIVALIAGSLSMLLIQLLLLISILISFFKGSKV